MNGMEIVVVKKLKLSSSVKKRIDDRKAKNMCIACGENLPSRRDICNRCYSRFQMRRPGKDKPIKRARYEVAAMAAGLIGDNRQGERSDLDVYRKVAAASGGSDE